MGYGGALIPLVSTLVAITLLPVVLAKLGPRLDWPHRRTDDKASRAWTRWAEGVARRRWLAAGAGIAVILALAFAATGLQLGTSDADTMAKSGDAEVGLTQLEKSGIGEGALLPHEVLVRAGLRRRRWPTTCGSWTGSTRPWRRTPRLAARRHRDCRGRAHAGQRHRRRRGHPRSRARGGGRLRPRREPGRGPQRTPTSSTRSTAASR